VSLDRPRHQRVTAAVDDGRARVASAGSSGGETPVIVQSQTSVHWQERKVRKAAVFILIFVLAPAAPVAAIEKCSVDDAAVENAGGYGRAVEAAVKSTSNCERAYQVLEVCQLGSSGDNALAAIVQSKCEPLFMDKAGPSTKKAYKKARDRCDKIAEKNEGTMYQGLAAVCRAKASRDLARKYSK
jgi:hypothetical protein